MYACIDTDTEEPVKVSLSRLRDLEDKVRIRFGLDLRVSLSVAEAVDLIDALAAALAELEGGAECPTK